MGCKLLLPLLALLAFYNSAWAVNEFLNSVSHRPDLFQYLAPVIPADELLFENGVLSQAGGICSKPQLAFCQQQFAGALSQTVEIFNDPIKFAELIRSYYKLQVPRGILQLCAAQLSFRNCMGIFYTPCTDAFNIYSGQSQTLDNAFILAGVYDDIEFDCGGGFTQTVAHWPCVTKVNNAADYDTTMQACVDAYNAATTNDPRAYCAAGQNLSACIGQGYKTLDNCVDSDVQWWACERIDRRVKLEGYCDSNNCVSAFPPPSQTRRETFMQFVENGGLFSEAQHAHFKKAVDYYKNLHNKQK